MKRSSKKKRLKTRKRKPRKNTAFLRFLLFTFIGIAGAALVALGTKEWKRLSWESKKVEVPVEKNIGSEGEGEGRFREPWGLAFSSAGLVVADFGNHRIQFFDPRGEFLKSLGKRGKNPGEFEQPCAVYVDPQNFLYVADTFNHRIQKFSPEGTFLRQWSRSFFGPRGITVWKDKVFVVDTGNHKIQVFNTEGTFLKEWGKFGELNGEFKEPIGAVVDDSGILYVADTDNRRIQKFDENGQWKGGFSIPSWQGKSAEVPYLAFYGGYLYATNAGRGAVLKMTPEGKLIAVYTRKGEEAGFAYASGIAVDPFSGRFFVSEKNKHRISVFREPVSIGKGR